MSVEQLMLPGVTTLWGPPGSTKSSIALTYPTTIAFYDFEYGGERAWQFKKMVEEGSVVIRRFSPPSKSLIVRETKMEGYLETWDQFVSQFEKDCADPEIFTIVLDTGTVVWALCRDAYLEQIQKTSPNRVQLIQIEYGEPNRRMDGLYTLAKSYQKDLVVTHHESDEYVPMLDGQGRAMLDQNGVQKSMITGNKLPEGFRHSLGLSDWAIQTKMVDNKPVGIVRKSAYGFDLLGKELNIPTYNVLVKMLQNIGRV